MINLILALWGAFKLNSDVGLIGSAAQGRVASARALDGSFVVAWEDWRNGNADIYFSLFDPTGNPIVQDVRANRDSTLEDQLNPAVAFGPDRFVIAWEDMRTPYPKVWFRLFSTTTGEPLFKAYQVDNYWENDNQRNPACAWLDSILWIAWEDERLGMEGIHARLFYPNGSAASFVINVPEDTNKAHANPSIGVADSTVMIAWQAIKSDTSLDAFYRVFRENGSPVGSAYSLVSYIGRQSYPLVLRWTEGFVVFWMSDSGPGPGIIGQAFTEFGSSLGFGQIVVFPGAPKTDLTGARLPGDTFAIAWLEEGKVMWATTDMNLGLISGPARLDDSPDSVFWFSVVQEGSGLVPFWTDRRRRDYDVYTSGGRMLNAEEPSQWTPSVSSAGRIFLSAWTDYRNDTGPRDNPDVYARLFTSSGPTGDDFPVPTQTSGKELYPSVVGLADSFLILWQDNRLGHYQIYGRFSDTLGNFLGGDFQLYPSVNYQAKPSAVRQGSGYVAVWEELVSDWVIRGVMKPAEIPLTISSVGDVHNPRVSALADGRFCVTWVQGGSAYARFYSSDGIPITLPMIISEPTHQVQDVSVAATDSIFTIAWEDIRHIYARSFRPDGSPASDIVTPATWERYQSRPSVAAFGDSIAILWDGWLNHPGLYIKQYNENVGNPGDGFAEMGDRGALPKQSYALGTVGTSAGVAAVWCDWRDSKGSDIYAETIGWDFPGVVELPGKSGGFSLLRNPVGDYLMIGADLSGSHTFVIYDPVGRRVKEANFDGPGQIRIPVSDLRPGVYVIASGKAWRESFVIVR
ncbi:MAG: hypothetical protein ABIN54_07460 [candidate division WOR-3 bacterium]